MAQYAYSFSSITPTAVADTTNITDSTYPGLIQGGTGTQRNLIREVYMGGEGNASSAPSIMVLARDSTVATGTISGGRNALTDASATAPATTALAGNAAATTKPQRSSTLHLLHLSFNAYGGLVRWVSNEGREPTLVGNTASLGEVSLSAFSGGTPGAMSGHIIYETV